MAKLNDLEVPDQLLADIERRAKVHGVTVAEQVVEDLSRIQAEKAGGAVVLDDIRVERESMARQGIRLTDDFLQEAKQWGRK
jgi:hypothetical protein